MFKSIIKGLLGGNKNETKSGNDDSNMSSSFDRPEADMGLMSEYKRLRKLYESDQNYAEELYEVCKEISTEEANDLYEQYINMNEEYNDLVIKAHELEEEEEDDEDEEQEYEKLVKTIRKKAQGLRVAYDSFLKKKYAARDKLFPEMVDRNKELYELDLRTYEENNSEDEELEEEIDIAAYMPQQGGGGISGMSSLPADSPLLQPIHGISLQDFAAAGGIMLKGIAEKDVLRILEVEKPMWDEVNVLWQQRMQQDMSFTLMTLYSEAYSNVDRHPKFANARFIAATSRSTSKENVEKVNQDAMFYAELAGARQAAISFGYDGAQFVLDNFGVSLEDMQAASLKHMANHAMIEKITTETTKKEKEYESRFIKELGPGIADDIEF